MQTGSEKSLKVVSVCLVLLEAFLALVRKSIIVSVQGPPAYVPRDLWTSQNREVSWVTGMSQVGCGSWESSAQGPAPPAIGFSALRKIPRTESFASQVNDA